MRHQNEQNRLLHLATTLLCKSWCWSTIIFRDIHLQHELKQQQQELKKKKMTEKEGTLPISTNFRAFFVSSPQYLNATLTGARGNSFLPIIFVFLLKPSQSYKLWHSICQPHSWFWVYIAMNMFQHWTICRVTAELLQRRIHMPMCLACIPRLRRGHLFYCVLAHRRLSVSPPLITSAAYHSQITCLFQSNHIQTHATVSPTQLRPHI